MPSRKSSASTKGRRASTSTGNVSSSLSSSAAAQLRKKKTSMSEIVNEQLSRGDAETYDPFVGEDGAVGGVAEAYEWGTAGSDSDGDAGYSGGGDARAISSSAAAGAGDRKRSRAAMHADATAPPKRLRHRGPLDQALSEGKYAAKPVANVEAVMEDIFGDLDMGDLDAEGEEVFDNGNGADGYRHDSAHDEGGDVSDGDGGYSDDEEAGSRARGKHKTKASKGKKAKDLTEEEYAAFLEAKRKRRRAALVGSGLSGVASAAVSGEEGAILEQLEELRKAQMRLVSGDADDGDNNSRANGDSISDAEQRRKNEALTRERTQEAVRHYIMLYAQLLRVRVLLQPAVTKAISLPQYYARTLFLEPIVIPNRRRRGGGGEGEVDDDGESEDRARTDATAKAYAAVCDDLRELLGMLYSLAQPSGKSNSAAGGAAAKRASAATAPPTPSFSQIHKFHASHARKRADGCLEYWGSKLVRANSAKLKTIAQPLPKQIEAILANMPRLRAKVRKNRAHLRIIGHPDHELAAAGGAAAADTPRAARSTALPSSNGAPGGIAATTARASEAALRRAAAIAEGDHDEEIYDDADFLRELVRRGGSVAHPLGQQLAELNRKVVPVQQASRKGFHKVTKGKEVSYEPRQKLVGFLMSEGFENSERNDVVLRSLFQ